MWTYVIKTGCLYDKTGQWAGSGYSGALGFKNDPASTGLIDKGPIPEGTYGIGAAVDMEEKGPVVLPLEPDPGNEMFGRSGFLVHGDSVEHPGAASEGCIILDRFSRELIAASGDNTLKVIATFTGEVD